MPNSLRSCSSEKIFPIRFSMLKKPSLRFIFLIEAFTIFDHSTFTAVPTINRNTHMAILYFIFIYPPSRDPRAIY